ncbi:MAG: GNAT family N-acetyltransferase [Promethearchaeota archaeon]
MTPRAPPFHVRTMRPGDLPSAFLLSTAAGWNQQVSDWERFLMTSPSGCFVGEVGGELVGTVVATAHGRKLGWIGMLLVERGHRRQGIGTTLLKVGVNFLRYLGIPTVGLDATPTGRFLYETLGFRPVGKVKRLAGVLPRVTHEGDDVDLVGAGEVGHATIADYDARAFGASRESALRGLVGGEGQSGWVLTRKGGAQSIAGYALTRPGRTRTQVGPIVAEGPESAARLLEACGRHLGDVEAFLDVPQWGDPGGAFRDELDRLGFVESREFTRMFSGARWEVPLAGARQYATSGPELG